MSKRIVAVQDISCFGRCSMQVVIPSLAHYGIQVCPLPTALLSTHTGGFDDFTFLDLTAEMSRILAHWKKLGLSFDAIYTGFLGTEKQLALVQNLLKDFSERKPFVLIDPVMGDNGEIYRTYTAAMCAGMTDLCERADLITPNLTEACVLLGIPYEPQPTLDRAAALTDALADRFGRKKTIAVTGIRSNGSDSMTVCFHDGASPDASPGFVSAPYCDVFFPGCGDLLASMLLGELLSGVPLRDALTHTVDFISRAAFHTARCKTPSREGLDFETLLAQEPRTGLFPAKNA